MKHVDILGQLEQVVEDTKPRRGQSFMLAQETVEARSSAALCTMRSTILPRIIQITNDQEDAITLAVANGRVADMTDIVMDGVQATLPNTTADHVAQILAMVCSGTGLRVLSTPPEDNDDIAATGLQISEIDAALGTLQPVHPSPEAAEPEIPEAEPHVPEPVLQGSDASEFGMATRFFEGAQRISDQRVLIRHKGSAVAGPDSVLTQNIDAVQQLMDDLSAWEADSDGQDSGPQLVILRAQDQDMPSLTICRDTEATSMTAHHTRRLGSVVQLWKSLTAQENFS
ncbi:hypothetical protein [Aliiroseovarius sp. S253]|uniref:hypothetical protein n=1 Tax=Aliiroseovarius sp. S253 TaxID=3415133 RepID=UPI003C7A26DE